MESFQNCGSSHSSTLSAHWMRLTWVFNLALELVTTFCKDYSSKSSSQVEPSVQTMGRRSHNVNQWVILMSFAQ